MARSATIGALHVTLGINTAAFEAGLNRVEKQLSRTGKQLKSIGSSMSRSLTAPLTLIGAGALKMSGDFDEAMARVRSVLRPTQAEFDALQQTAEHLGRTTKFSASQAADGIEMLARNGLKAGDILNGAATATLNLAAAAGADLAPAADVMTDIMVNFGKRGEELTGVVDNIAGTLANSKFAWDDYAAAAGQAAGVAGKMGMSLEDMNAALAATAPSFSSGEEAGTSFKNMLLRLAPSSKQSKALIRQLGLEFFDAAGRLKPLEEIAEELRLRLKDLTQEAQLEVLGQLFGSRTIRTAVALMHQGAEGIRRIKAELANVSAEEMAAARLDNFNGALTLLKSAIEGLAIAIGKAGLLQWARSFVEGLTDITNSLSETSPRLLKWGTIIAGLAAAIGPLLVSLGFLSMAIGAIGAPVAIAVTAIAGITAAVVTFWQEIKTLATMAAQGFQNVWIAAKTWLLDKVTPLFQSVGRAARLLGVELGGLFGEVTAEGVAQAAKTGGMAGLRGMFDEMAEGWQTTVEEAVQPMTNAMIGLNEQLFGTKTLTEQNTEAEREHHMALMEGRAITESLMSPLEEYEATLQRLIQLRAHDAISARTHALANQRAAFVIANSYAGLASDVAGAFRTMFGESKAAAIASAIANTAQAVTRTLAVYGGTPWGWAQAAAAAAAGMAQLATIRSTNYGGGGRTPSVSSGAAEPASAGGAQPGSQLPTQTLHVQGINPNDIFTGETMRALMEQLLQRQRDGAQVVLA